MQKDSTTKTSSNIKNKAEHILYATINQKYHNYSSEVIINKIDELIKEAEKLKEMLR